MKKIIFLTLLIVVFAGSANAADPNFPNLHMPLDASPDDIIVPLTGTVVGDPLTYSAGMLDNAANMNGTNMISYDYTLESSTFSVAMWVNPANVGIGWRGMLDIRDDIFGDESRRVMWIGNNPTGILQAQVFPSGLYDSNVTLLGTTPLINGTWMHIVFTHDGTTAKLYVNGQLEDQAAASGDLAYLGPDLTVGGEPGRVWGGGSIDDVRIYNNVLAASDVTALYDSYIDPDDPPTITDQPDTQAVKIGDSVEFTVAAINPFTGDDTGLTYQWYKVGTPDTLLAGEESASMTIASVAAGDLGSSYYCQVTLTTNGQTTDSAVATLVQAALIVDAPMEGVIDDLALPASTAVADPAGGDGPTFVYSAAQGLGLYADGTADNPGVIYSNDIALNTGEFSIALWIKDIAFQAGENAIVNIPVPTMSILLVNDGRVSFNFNNGLTKIETPQGYAHEGDTFHLAFTYDGADARMYINGSQYGGACYFGIDVQTEGPFTVAGIGADPLATGSLAAIYDEVKLYNYAISPTEVTDLYNAVSPFARPQIDIQPVSVVVDAAGAPASFTVAATNPLTSDTTGLDYIWYLDGSPLDPNGPTLDIANVQVADLGQYYCEVKIISNGYSTNSAVATLTVASDVTGDFKVNLEDFKAIAGEWLYDGTIALPAAILRMPMDGDPNDVIVPITGTPTGGVTYSGGMIDQAVDLDGVDGEKGPPETAGPGTKIEYNYSLSSSVFSVAMWVKPQDLSWWRAIMYMRGAERDLTTSSFMIGQCLDGPAVFHVFPDGTDDSRTSVETTGPVLTEGTWTHIACTHDGTDMKLYIDGALDNEGPAGGPLTYLGPLLKLGVEWCTDYERCYNGSIDEVRLFDFGLDAPQVASLYTGELCDPPAYDATGDCKVNLEDLEAIAGSWLLGI